MTLEDCCELNDVYKEDQNCHSIMCTNKCEDKPWEFVEKNDLSTCKKFVQGVSSCCGYDSS